MAARVLFAGAYRSADVVEALLVEARTYKRDKDGKFGSGGGGGDAGSSGSPPAAEPAGGGAAGVDALPRMKKPPTVRQAAQGTNPDFGTTNGMDQPVYRDAGRAGQRYTPDMGPLPSGAFEENCTNCVQAFEMRMRGYDVTAAPLDVLDKYGYAAGRTYKETDEHLASSWQNPDGSPHGRSFSGQQWRSFKEVDAEVQSWPEGGRGYMTTGTHVFAVVKAKGKVQYVEPQFAASPTRIVTALYRRKYGSPKTGFGSGQDAKMVRLDDLVPAPGIMESVVAA